MSLFFLSFFFAEIVNITTTKTNLLSLARQIGGLSLRHMGIDSKKEEGKERQTVLERERARDRVKYRKKNRGWMGYLRGSR